MDANHPTTTDAPGDVVISSIEQLDNALRELAELEIREKRLKGDLERKVEVLKEDHAERLFVEIDGQRVKFADRRSTLSNAIEQFATEHRGELLTGKGKSRKLNHGELGWKKARDVVEPLPAPKPTAKQPTPLAPFAALCEKLLKSLHKCVEAFAPLKGLTSYVRVTVAVDEATLITGIRDRKVSDEDVKRLGYKFVEGEEKFWHKPAQLQAGSLETVD